MSDTEDTAACSHCGKEVKKENLHTHEAHCRRFLCLCPDCDEQVPKEQLEEHREEQHTVVKCKKCNMKMERCDLLDHEKSECMERLESCEFCQLDLPLRGLREHTVACGSRTELCKDCNQYVTLKDQLQHVQTCGSENQLHTGENKAINNQMKSLSIKPPQDVQNVSSHSASKPAADAKPEHFSLSARQRKSERGIQDDDQISACPLCHLALPVKTLRWHENKCRINEILKQM